MKKLQRLYSNGNGNRRYICGTLELKSCMDARPLLVRINLMDESSKVVDGDGSSTPAELIAHLAEKIDLKDKAGFALYVVAGDQGNGRILGYLLLRIGIFVEEFSENFLIIFDDNFFILRLLINLTKNK